MRSAGSLRVSFQSENARHPLTGQVRKQPQHKVSVAGIALRDNRLVAIQLREEGVVIPDGLVQRIELWDFARQCAHILPIKPSIASQMN